MFNIAVKTENFAVASLDEMTPEEREKLNDLCQQIAIEKSHEKFLRLVQELNDLLEKKHQRLEDKTKQR